MLCIPNYCKATQPCKGKVVVSRQDPRSNSRKLVTSTPTFLPSRMLADLCPEQPACDHSGKVHKAMFVVATTFSVCHKELLVALFVFVLLHTKYILGLLNSLALVFRTISRAVYHVTWI